MTSPTIVFLCTKLAHDRDLRVQEIGKRCLAAYNEFVGMRYANLTTRDEEQFVAAVRAANESEDVDRAALLQAGLDMIGADLLAHRQRSAKEALRAKPRSPRRKVKDVPPSDESRF
jgi:hypothetical protein